MVPLTHNQMVWMSIRAASTLGSDQQGQQIQE
jgi:hypothetical protein